MRYTEHEYKLDHIFDYIRLFASFILGAFRLLGEIGNKIVYLRVKGEINTLTLLLKKALLLNVGAIVITFVYDIFCEHYGVSKGGILFSGTVPVISFILSLVILFIFFIVSTRLKQPALSKFTGKKIEDNIDNIDDIDSEGVDVDINEESAETDKTSDATKEEPEQVIEKNSHRRDGRIVGSMTDEEVKKQPPMSSDVFKDILANAKNKPKGIDFPVPSKLAPNVQGTVEPTTYNVEPNNVPQSKPNPLLSRNATKDEIKGRASELSQYGNIADLKSRNGGLSGELARKVSEDRKSSSYFKIDNNRVEEDDDLDEDYS